MDKIIEIYRGYLDGQKGHLSSTVLSAYINFINDLSRKEKNFIEKHLAECSECKSRLINIFDEEFDLDDEIQISELSKHWHKDINYQEFTSNQNGCSIAISEEENRLFVIIRALPEVFTKRNLRLVLYDGTIMCRIISANTGRKFVINKKLKPEILRHGKIIVQSFNSEDELKNQSVSKIKNPFVYSAAAAILMAFFLFIYFSFIQPGGFNKLYHQPLVIKDTTSRLDTVNKSLERPMEQLVQTNTGGKNKFEKKSRHNEIAAAFMENAVLENFISREVRSSGGIVIIQPRINESIKNFPIKFIWNGEKGKTYKLIIVNNKNNEIYSIEIKKSVFRFGGKLKPGLYYWKLEVDNILAAVSKFAVLK